MSLVETKDAEPGTDVAIPKTSFGAELARRKPQFHAALPAQMSPDKFMRVVLTAVQTNPDLQRADPRSFWNACMRAAQDGLLPDGREGALVPFAGHVT